MWATHGRRGREHDGGHRKAGPAGFVSIRRGKNVPANPAKFAAVPAPRPVNQRFPLMQTYIPPIDLEPMNARFSKLLTGRSCFALAALFWLATPVVSDAATLWLASKGPTTSETETDSEVKDDVEVLQ